MPEPVAPLASYVPVRISGDHAYVAGQVPMEDGTSLPAGKLVETACPWVVIEYPQDRFLETVGGEPVHDLDHKRPTYPAALRLG